MKEKPGIQTAQVLALIEAQGEHWAVGRPSGLTTRLDRLGVQLPAENAPSLACLCDDCPDEVGVGGSRSIPPEQNLPSHHH